jgi:hypothetical protein
MEGLVQHGVGEASLHELDHLPGPAQQWRNVLAKACPAFVA